PRMPGDSPSDAPPGPSVFAAFEKQLGLKLAPTKAPQESLLIDRIERPSEKLVETSQNAAPQRFEVSSVKTCDDQAVPALPFRTGARQGGGGPVTVSADRLTISCVTLVRLIGIAYVTNGDSLSNNQPVVAPDKFTEWIKNLPEWVRTETFSIEGKADRPVD